MSYVQRVLQPGEQVRMTATIHWITYLPGFTMLVLAVAALFGRGTISGWDPFWEILAAALGVIAILMIFRAWFHRWITEIAVTDRRVIYKTGFISRKTNEMHMDKVESVEVNQSVLGRMFDYGDVTIKGTGDSHMEGIRMIGRPLDLRNQITGR
jgi:uncharacterized membrane protein YdbT with pleckstrin-like domain